MYTHLVASTQNGLSNASRETVIEDSAEYFRLIKEAIDSAHHFVALETYIYTADDEVSRVITQALTAAARRGVEVHVIIDAWGSAAALSTLVPVFNEARVKLRIFHPVTLNRLTWINKRDHRKVVIIDDRMAFIGSFNITADHLSWRDAAVIIEGQLVEHIHASFLRVWRRSTPAARAQRRKQRSLLRHHHWHYSCPPVDGLMTTETVQSRRYSHHLLFRKVREAKKVLWMTTPYFIPRRILLWAFGDAALRGVDVRLLVPRRSDVPWIRWVSESYYAYLLRRGARVYEYLPKILHAKTLIIDDWCRIGSSNLNHRSFIHDLEIDVVLSQESSCAALNEMFLSDIKQADELTLEKLAARPLYQRILGRIMRFFRYMS